MTSRAAHSHLSTRTGCGGVDASRRMSMARCPPRRRPRDRHPARARPRPRAPRRGARRRAAARPRRGRLGRRAGPVAATDAALAARVTVARIEQPYRVAGRRSAAPPPAGRGVARRPRGADRRRARRGLPHAIGGRSSGARVACRTAADDRRRRGLVPGLPAAPAAALPDAEPRRACPSWTRCACRCSSSRASTTASGCRRRARTGRSSTSPARARPPAASPRSPRPSASGSRACSTRRNESARSRRHRPTTRGAPHAQQDIRTASPGVAAALIAGARSQREQLPKVYEDAEQARYVDLAHADPRRAGMQARARPTFGPSRGPLAGQADTYASRRLRGDGHTLSTDQLDPSTSPAHSAPRRPRSTRCPASSSLRPLVVIDAAPGWRKDPKYYPLPVASVPRL